MNLLNNHNKHLYILWEILLIRTYLTFFKQDSLEGMMLKLKLQYFGHLMWRLDSLEKTLMLGGIGDKRKRGQQDEMAGCHHWLDGRESEWTQGVGDGHGGLACCDSWGRRESDTTERLNWTELNWSKICQNVLAIWIFFKSCNT